MQAHTAAAVDRNGFEFFLAHQCANTAACCKAVSIIDYTGQQRQPFATWADTGNLGGCAGESAQSRFGSGWELAPERFCRANLHRPVADPQVDRFGRLTLNNQEIVSRELQFRPEKTSRVGAGDSSGKWCFANNHVTGCRWRTAACKRASAEDKGVFRAKRIYCWIDLCAQQARSQPATSDEIFRHLNIQRLPGHGTSAEVDSQNVSAITVIHGCLCYLTSRTDR